MSIKGKAYIAGIYEHPTRKADGISLARIHAEVAKGALEDAGLSHKDVDGYFCAGDSPGLGPLNMADYLGLQPKHIDSTDTGGSSYQIHAAHAAEAIALWVMHAHALDAFQISPILAMLSPEKRCAKTTTLTIIYNLLPRPVLASNVSPASIFRLIQEFNATLLIDEFDTFVQHNDELRGVINSGHQRNAANVLRVSGDELEPKLFSTWRRKSWR